MTSSWHRRPESSTGGITNSSPSTFAEVVDLGGQSLERELAELADHCARCVRSEAEDVRQWGQKGAGLVARLQEALQQKPPDVRGVAALALALGLYVREWQVKDVVEPDFLERLRQRAGRRGAGKGTIFRPFPGDATLDAFREWWAKNPGATREAAYEAVGEDEDRDPKLVKRAVLRAEKREDKRERGRSGGS